MKAKSLVVNVRMSKAMYRSLGKVARKLEAKRSDIMREAFSEYLATFEPKKEIQSG